AVFQQAAGFLFVKDGPNPFDAARIHPEWYPVAEKILAEFGYRPEDLNSPAIRQALNERMKDLPLDQLAKRLEIPMPVLFDIVGEFNRPAQDPRARRPGAIFRNTITRIEDLKIGMWVRGTVRNVVDFGAFVDVGLEEDGLLHISQFSKRYVRDPLKFLGIGDTIDVRIMSIDHKRQRTALSMIREEAKPAAAPPTEKKAEPESAAAEAPRKPEHKPALPVPEPAKKTPVEKPAPVSSARAARVPRLSERGGPVSEPPARRPTRRTSERQPGRKPATRAPRPARSTITPSRVELPPPLAPNAATTRDRAANRPPPIPTDTKALR
ncbi:MAG: S1 RNA-binding domain-containing protein, partial [Phycisphaerae bacterium]|nr:S1 RNA-binding domain-containing protein [Phycisphaerae bacterium]